MKCRGPLVVAVLVFTVCIILGLFLWLGSGHGLAEGITLLFIFSLIKTQLTPICHHSHPTENDLESLYLSGFEDIVGKIGRVVPSHRIPNSDSMPLPRVFHGMAVICHVIVAGRFEPKSGIGFRAKDAKHAKFRVCGRPAAHLAGEDLDSIQMSPSPLLFTAIPHIRTVLRGFFLTEPRRTQRKNCRNSHLCVFVSP